MDYIRDIRELHERTISPIRGKPVGCSEEQIADLEARIGFKFPGAYAQFLRWMGEDYEGVFVGSDCFIGHVERNTLYLPSLLEKNRIAFQLPPHYLAFFSHQGYQMVWFALPAESDDPMCWGYCEGKGRVPKSMGTFTEWLRECTEALSQLIVQLHSDAS